MYLRYRGIFYASFIVHIKKISTELTGTYRGAPWRTQLPDVAPTPDAAVPLRYRGSSYLSPRYKLSSSPAPTYQQPGVKPSMQNPNEYHLPN